MKIAVTLGALALVAQLAGCPQTSVNTTDVITIAQQLCKFAPDLPTVNAIINANGALKTATAIAQAICSAVPAPAASSRLGATTGDVQVGTLVVNGKNIPIVGHYTVGH